MVQLIILNDISVNQELPSTIGHLKSLVILNVDRNRLSSLPAEVTGVFFYIRLSLCEQYSIRK